jgi:hypothetical protein
LRFLRYSGILRLVATLAVRPEPCQVKSGTLFGLKR